MSDPGAFAAAEAEEQEGGATAGRRRCGRLPNGVKAKIAATRAVRAALALSNKLIFANGHVEQLVRHLDDLGGGTRPAHDAGISFLGTGAGGLIHKPLGLYQSFTSEPDTANLPLKLCRYMGCDTVRVR